MDPSPVYRGNRDGDITIVRQWKVPWANAENFVLAFLTGGAFGLPVNFPGNAALLADDFTIEPFSGQVANEDPAREQPFTPTNTYEFAKVTIAYTPVANDRDFAVGDDPQLPDGTFGSYSSELGGEFITLPGRRLMWESGILAPDPEARREFELDPDTHPAIVIPKTDHLMTWNNISDPPWTAMSKLRGMVNRAEFRMPMTRKYFAAETLMFFGGRERVEFKLGQTEVQRWQVEYHFMERAAHAVSGESGAVTTQPGESLSSAAGWNHFWNPETNMWERVVDIENFKPLYTLGDFTQLFSLET